MATGTPSTGLASRDRLAERELCSGYPTAIREAAAASSKRCARDGSRSAARRSDGDGDGGDGHAAARPTSCCAARTTRPANRSRPVCPKICWALAGGAPKNRLGLAQWLTKPDHPLTSRVVVNRFWQQLFGTGTREDQRKLRLAGRMAEPSRTARLAGARVHRLRLEREGADASASCCRATYRQDSAASPELIARDPENRLLARGPRFRLPAEMIRDQALLDFGSAEEPARRTQRLSLSAGRISTRASWWRPTIPGRSTSTAQATTSIAAACTRSGNAPCRIRR